MDTTEKKQAADRRKRLADIPFFIALGLCLYVLTFAVQIDLLVGTAFCVLLTVIFTAIRYLDKGELRPLRRLIFYIFITALFAVVINGVLGVTDLLFAFILLPFLILAFWLYTVG
jgi:hypothetical protein